MLSTEHARGSAERRKPKRPEVVTYRALCYTGAVCRGSTSLMRELTLWQAVAISTQFGFLLAASVLIGLVLGWLVDSWTQIGAIAYLVGALLGLVSGVFSVVKLVQTFLRK